MSLTEKGTNIWRLNTKRCTRNLNWTEKEDRQCIIEAQCKHMQGCIRSVTWRGTLGGKTSPSIQSSKGLRYSLSCTHIEGYRGVYTEDPFILLALLMYNQLANISTYANQTETANCNLRPASAENLILPNVHSPPDIAIKCQQFSVNCTIKLSIFSYRIHWGSCHKGAAALAVANGAASQLCQKLLQCSLLPPKTSHTNATDRSQPAERTIYGGCGP